MSGAMGDKRAGLQEKRRLRNRRRGIVASLACAVALATAVVLMVPAISMTHDDLDQPQAAESTAAEQLEVQAEDAADEASDAQDASGRQADAESDAKAAPEKEPKASGEAKAQAKPESKQAEPEPEPEPAAEPEPAVGPAQEPSPAEAGEVPAAHDDGAQASEEQPATEPDATEPEAGDDPDFAGDEPSGDDEALGGVAADEDAGSADMPAQSFYGELRDKKDRLTLSVDVDAPEGALPAGVTMQVQAVKAKDVKDAIQDALDEDKAGKLTSVQAVDIIFLDAEGVEVEPATTVNVKLCSPQIAQAADDEANEPLVAHVDDEGKARLVDVLTDKQLAKRDIQREDDELLFDAESFSVYAIVYTVDFHAEVDGEAYDLSILGGDSIGLRELLVALGVVAGEDAEAFVRDVADVQASDPALLAVVQVAEDATAAELRQAAGLNPEFSGELSDDEIAAMDAKPYTAPDWALFSLASFDTQETLTITMKAGEAFTLKVTDARDPLGLSGRTFSIFMKSGGHTLQANGSNIGSMALNVNDGTQYMEADGVEYTKQDATAWKFEYNEEKKAYQVSYNGRYLRIDTNATSGTPSLTTDADDAGTWITITRDDDGNYLLGNAKGTVIVDNNGSFALTTNSSATNAAARLCLPENPYGSHKATLVAAKDLSDGQSVVIYQKLWNNATDDYDFYAIDGNGDLQRIWDSSDALYWKENLSIEWKLVELKNDDGTPTGYLQLYNEATKTYLAPKSNGSGYAVTHDESGLTEATMKTVSVSLPGRDAGEYSSRIATWDYDDNTTYGIDLAYDPSNASEPYTLQVKELLQSRDFLFAVRDPVVQKQLTTVDTVDSISKGIKISMYDFEGNRYWNGNRLDYMSRIIGDPVWGSGYYTPGIMSRTLGSDGYPTSEPYNYGTYGYVGGQSLKNVFEPSDASDGYYVSRKVENANHLFLQSVYDNTGYFYYSGFDNAAYLPNGSNDFVVYEQLVTPKNEGVTNGAPSKPEDFFYYRGNFLPFNEPDVSNPVLNYYDGGDQRKELEEGNPRKSEDLYTVKGNPDYFFGMILESKFKQGPNGLSDQGDPMVFEFTGDDDMWVYVDGVLLLDIGGVHDAFHGKINFQTGKIHVDGQKTGDEDTYIKEQYWQAHKYPDGSDWTDRDDPKQNEFFTNGGEENGKLKGTYLDYTSHDLKMFYMERGAGASNLQIQFNLPVITGDEFRVTKNMLTTATGKPIQSAYADAAFYYKAYIKQGDSWVEYKRTDFPADTAAVYDDDARTPVVWKDDTTFEVKPGQTAVIPVASSAVEYKVVEVEPEPGISHMLDDFNVSNSDQDAADSASTTGKTVKRRGQVFFDNKPVDEIVNELRITKNLHGDLYKDASTKSGFVEDQNGSPYYEFKIFLEATNGQIVPYSLGEYYQIDGDTGRYVYYDKGTRLLAEPTAEGRYKYTYPNSGKSDEVVDQPKITEHTSQNGSLGDVRPGDTIIVKGLMEGTDFVVDERLDRTHMTETDEGDWSGKYYFSRTDVKGAMQRDGDAPTEQTKPDNYDITGDMFKKPSNSDELAVSGKAARGTIVSGKDAEVIVHNEVYNQFELPLQKTWSEDFDMDALADDAQVTFTLKRYKLEDRKGTFTFNAKATGMPSGFDPEYTFTNQDTGEAFTVKFSELDGSGSTRVKNFSLPIGTYTLSYGEGPEGYDVAHAPSGATVTVSADAGESGAVANPSSISVESTYARQTGSIAVTKRLEGFHGNNSFENFTATYTVTDTAGKPVKDAAGAEVQPVTLRHGDFANGVANITFSNLPAGQYLVREAIASSSYDNDKYTVVNTASPENGIASVVKDAPAEVAFTSAYTEVKSNPVPITVKLSNIWNNEVVTLESNTTSFRPGDRIVFTFMRWANNSDIRYRVNNDNWVRMSDVSSTRGYVRVLEEIHMTVPDGGITIEFQDDWNQLTKDDVSVYKEQTTLQAMQSAQAMRSNAAARVLAAAPKRVAAATTTDVPEISNVASVADPLNSKQMYSPDSWSLTVTMRADGKLLGADGGEVGSIAQDGYVWRATLEGVKFDGLVATDDDGNRYHYYIDTLAESDVPIGTKPTIDVDADGTKLLYPNPDSRDAAERVLSASNELVVAYGDVSLQKLDHEGHAMAGAEFALYRSYKNGKLANPLQDSDGMVVAKSGQEGTLPFTDVPSGVWYLKEVKAPEGFRVSPVIYQVEISVKPGEEGKDDPETETTVTVLGSTDPVTQVVNTPITYGEVDFQKQDAEGGALADAAFTLFTDYACTQPVLVEGAAVTAISGEDGRVRFTAAQTVKGQEVRGIETGDYYFKETAAPEGYALSDKVFFAHIGDGVDGDMSFIAIAEEAPAVGNLSVIDYYRAKKVSVVENEPVRIVVKKVDENGLPLSGAQFTLTRAGAAPDTKPAAGESDLAVYEFGPLTDGAYTLHEIAPAGYDAVSDVTFNVSEGVVRDVSRVPGVTWDGSFAFTVKNEPTPDSGKIVVRKQWLDFFGNAIDYNASIDLALLQWVDVVPEQHLVNVEFRYVGDGSGDRNSTSGLFATRSGSGNGDVTITWGLDQWTESVASVSVRDQMGNGYTGITTSGKKSSLTIRDIRQDLNITVLIDNWGWKGYDDASIGQLSFSNMGAPVEGTVEPAGKKTLTLNADTGWSASFTVSGDGRLTDASTVLPRTMDGRACYYTIEEDSALEGFELWQISADKAQSGVLTAYNKRTSVDLTIQKVAAGDASTKLNGATFELRQLDIGAPGVHYQSADPLASGSTSGEGANAGALAFENLGVGYYEIRETATPAGYVVSGDDAFYIRIDANGMCLLRKDASVTADKWAAVSSNGMVRFDADAAIATVGNEPGIPLPTTGGMGTQGLTVGGMLLVLAAVALLVRRRVVG